MSDQLVNVSLGDVVREKVKKVLLDAIPEESINSLIKKEYEQFFEENKDRYNNRPVGPSPFSLLIKAEIEVQLKVLVKDKINEQLKDMKYDSDGQFMGDMVAKMAPFVLEGISKSIASHCIQQLRNHINTNQY